MKLFPDILLEQCLSIDHLGRRVPWQRFRDQQRSLRRSEKLKPVPQQTGRLRQALEEL